MSESRDYQQALNTALLSPLFLGMAPIFGKIALSGGSDPFTLAAIRTTLASLFLWVLYLICWRKYIYIYTAGFLGCAVVGTVNGIGSLLYYNGLSRMDASLAQLLNGTYLIFVVLLVRIGGQTLSWRTGLRVLLAIFGLLLITGGMRGMADWLGVGLMLGNALLFAGTMILSQRVLYEMPAQTVTLYVMSVMAVVVIMARAAYNVRWMPQTGDAMFAIVALAISTALSRLVLFSGVKSIGGLQTSLLAIAEIAVSVTLSYLFLDERLTVVQWIGVGAFLISLLLYGNARYSTAAPQGAFPLPNMASITFQQIAFNHAFGNSDMSQDELDAIRHMMGADGPLRLDYGPLPDQPAETAPADTLDPPT